LSVLSVFDLRGSHWFVCFDLLAIGSSSLIRDVPLRTDLFYLFYPRLFHHFHLTI